jgi:hypothetical protein
MDERFRGKGLSIGLGALAIVFLCLMMCGFVTRVVVPPAQVYVQPPAGDEGLAPPPPYYGYGPTSTGRHGSAGPFGFIFGLIGGLFKLAFMGLFLLLLLGLVTRVFFGSRHWGPPPWGRPPNGKQWKGRHHGRWGPWAWHCHGKFWEPEGEPTGEEDESDSAEFAYGGPQE